MIESRSMCSHGIRATETYSDQITQALSEANGNFNAVQDSVQVDRLCLGHRECLNQREKKPHLSISC